MEKLYPGIDLEVCWVKKASKCHFGYKLYMVVNQGGLVVAEETALANEGNIKYLETPLGKTDVSHGTPVSVDKGYDSEENRDVLLRMRLKSCNMHKARKNWTQTGRENTVNKAMSKIGHAVERTFGSMYRCFGVGVAKDIDLAKTTHSISWRPSPTACTPWGYYIHSYQIRGYG